MTWLASAFDVIPLNDLRDHVSGPKCWCDPVEDDVAAGLYVHKSADGRESFEDGSRKPS